MNPIKSVFSCLVFLLLATGFFVLISFEIHYGVAGGKFGGAELISMPGTFWFVVGIQAVWGLSLTADSIKELWKLTHKNVESNEDDKDPQPAKAIAIYWILATIFIVLLNLLAMWSAVETVFKMYKLISYYEMPRKAILGVLFLMSFGVFCYLSYMFLFRSLVETLFPKALNAFRVLQKNK